ncbi:type II toxin-antitoxin system HicB family antitoxin [Mariluticola halotolerans]|uniref:type II toxin-antitoxin system HicB family antitoxin n=1 Tax=Mariluticola halotolerans TaxID=2909283 RepID=UPI003F5FCD71
MKKNLSYQGYQASVEFDAEDDIFVGRVLGINDVVGFHADDVKTLKQAFAEAVDDYLATCRKLGKTPEKLFSGNLMLRIAPSVHAKASLAAEAEGKSLNQWSEEVLLRATTRFSDNLKARQIVAKTNRGRQAARLLSKTSSFKRQLKR